jgi:2-dehydro-3-deoxy-D-gluconate 5-dehydrogenase
MNLLDLTGRVAVVTGGHGGIGFAIASGFVLAGARVALAARDVAKSAECAERLRKLGGDAIALPLDVRERASCVEVAERTVEHFGGIDVLVNCAGINIRKRPEDYTLDEWHQISDTNLRGTFLCCQAVHGPMVTRGRGKIINVGSMQSIFGGEFTAPLAASKGGIVQLTRALAVAWAKDNIQVNVVLPGWVDTALTRRGSQRVPGLKERVTERTPAGRWGVPEDHQGVTILLASAASDFITGATIAVDGGYSVNG